MECQPPTHIKFDFLGKDSIRYENQVEVDPLVYKAVESFKRRDQYGKSEWWATAAGGAWGGGEGVVV